MNKESKTIIISVIASVFAVILVILGNYAYQRVKIANKLQALYDQAGLNIEIRAFGPSRIGDLEIEINDNGNLVDVKSNKILNFEQISQIGIEMMNGKNKNNIKFKKTDNTKTSKIIILSLVFIVFLYFAIWVPYNKEKKQRLLITQFKEGDCIITLDGVTGKISKVASSTVFVTLEEGTIQLNKNSIYKKI